MTHGNSRRVGKAHALLELLSESADDDTKRSR
jgi:hypothetical protein